MKKIPVQLLPITVENWRQCIDLQLDAEQEPYISSNLFSLAQSKFELNRCVRAIYNVDNMMVGFAMYNDTPLDDGSFRISRLMIDAVQQRKGYGWTAANAIIDVMRKLDGCNMIHLDHHPDNVLASRFWHSLGFRECGLLGKNIQLRLTLK